MDLGNIWEAAQDILIKQRDELIEENERLKQVIRGYRGILQEAGVHITHSDIEAWHNRNEKLLRVARAAKAIDDAPFPIEVELLHERLDELREALAEVKDLL